MTKLNQKTKPARNFSDDRIKELAEFLNGSYTTLNSALMMQMTVADHQALDDEVIECVNCGWWCRADEMDDGNCSDCHKDAEDDED